MIPPRIAVIYGGISEEREVSLKSGRALAEALSQNFAVDLFEIDEAFLPQDLEKEEQVVFPALHGAFGEDGGIQQELEERGFAFAGCGSQASRLCFDKEETKSRVAEAGIVVAPSLVAEATAFPKGEAIMSCLGALPVVKPVSQGSSVGLFMPESEEALEALLLSLKSGKWLLEKRIHGREITVGILEGKSLGLVEICPRDGVFDYEHKYTKNLTEYRYPAKISPTAEADIREAAEGAFLACHCRDFARIDFILSEDGVSYFLEINTVPGLTETSLLPMSASCWGYNFPELAQRLAMPAIDRFQRAYAPLS